MGGCTSSTNYAGLGEVLLLRASASFWFRWDKCGGGGGGWVWLEVVKGCLQAANVSVVLFHLCFSHSLCLERPPALSVLISSLASYHLLIRDILTCQQQPPSYSSDQSSQWLESFFNVCVCLCCIMLQISPSFHRCIEFICPAGKGQRPATGWHCGKCRNVVLCSDTTLESISLRGEADTFLLVGCDW